MCFWRSAQAMTKIHVNSENAYTSLKKVKWKSAKETEKGKKEKETKIEIETEKQREQKRKQRKH